MWGSSPPWRLEVGFLIDRLSSVRTYSGPAHKVIEGELGGKLVALIITGVGREAAGRGTELLLAGHAPRWLLSVGFAGGLDPQLARLSIVLPSEVIDLQSERHAIDVRVPDSGGASQPRVHTGRLLTVDRIIATAVEKAELRRTHGADLVDMESSAVASVCARRGIRLLSIRIISDEAGIDLPPEVVQLLSHTGSYRVGAALRAIWRRPSRIKDFWNLHEQAQEAADRLAGFVAQALGRLD